MTILTPLRPTLRLSFRLARLYSTTSPQSAARNHIYPTAVRDEQDFESLNLLSASSRIPLITLWGAPWCPSCKIITPLVRDMISSGIGEEHGGVSFAEVQMDSPTIGGLAMRYVVNSMPTLLAFDRQEAQLETRVTRVDDLKNRAFLEEWIKTEARRHGHGGAGGSLFNFLGFGKK